MFYYVKISLSPTFTSGFDGITNPSKNDIIMPAVINSYVITPIGPLTSIGAVSLMNNGTKTENDPLAIP